MGQDALGDAARRRLAEGKRRDAVERFRRIDGRDVERAQGGPRRVLLVRRRHEDERRAGVPFRVAAHCLAANNLASTLGGLERFEETGSLIRKMTPVARRVLGESHDLTLKMSYNYAEALYNDDDPALDDIREAVGTLEEIERTARRVLGGAHPLTEGIGDFLRHARKELRAREAG